MTGVSQPSCKPDRGQVRIDQAECKGCGLCVVACPLEVLRVGACLNAFGYHPAEYVGHGCSGCGLCFYACPEPGAIQVLKLVSATQPGYVEATDQG